MFKDDQNQLNPQVPPKGDVDDLIFHADAQQESPTVSQR